MKSVMVAVKRAKVIGCGSLAVESSDSNRAASDSIKQSKPFNIPYGAAPPAQFHTMQKVLRRSLLARNQALKKARKLEHQEFKKEKQNSLRESVVRQRVVNSFIKDERKTRREDWISGPLAPQRNAGAAKGIYGTLNMEASRIPTIPEKQREKYINFTVGDRVCAVRGRNRGRIGEITEVDAGRMTVTVEGFNQVQSVRQCQSLPSYKLYRLIKKFPHTSVARVRHVGPRTNPLSSRSLCRT